MGKFKTELVGGWSLFQIIYFFNILIQIEFSHIFLGEFGQNTFSVLDDRTTDTCTNIHTDMFLKTIS